MTVKELIERLSSVPDERAEVVVDVFDPKHPDKDLEYLINDVVDVKNLSKHEVHIKV